MAAAGARRSPPRRWWRERGARSADAGPTTGQGTRGRVEAGQGRQRLVRGGHGQPKRKYQVVRGLNNLGYSERVACQAVGLSRSTYYKIKYRQPTDRDIREVMLADAIADIHARSRG